MSHRDWGTFLTSRVEESCNYEKTTDLKRDRLDNCPFSAQSHKPTVSGSGELVMRAGVFGRRVQQCDTTTMHATRRPQIQKRLERTDAAISTGCDGSGHPPPHRFMPYGAVAHSKAKEKATPNGRKNRRSWTLFCSGGPMITFAPTGERRPCRSGGGERSALHTTTMRDYCIPSDTGRRAGGIAA